MFYLLHYYDTEDENWIRSSGYQDDSKFEKYMLSLFWTLQTITTVGFGTVALSNSLEKLYAIIIIIIGATIYSFIVGSISSSVHNDEAKSVKLQNNMKTLKKMGNYENLPKELIERIERFIRKNMNLNGSASGSSSVALQKILSELPERLKIELIKHTHKDVINKNSFFFGKSFEFALNVLSIQTEITIPSNDILYKKGDPAEEVYIVYQGSIKFLSEDWIPFVKYGNGSYFGEIEVLFKEERSNAAYAEQETVLGVINREKLDKIFKDFKIEEEEFKNIANERKKNNAKALEKAVQREKELNLNKNRRQKIMEKFGNYITYQELISQRKRKSEHTIDHKTQALLARYILV